MKWLVLPLLIAFLCGCSGEATRTVVVTATPRPTSPPTGTPTRTATPVVLVVTVTPRAPALPVSTATASSGITLVGVRVEDPSLAGAGNATLDYSIDNGTGETQDVFLGATAYSEAAPQFTVEDYDRTILSLPGTHVYQRILFFPEAARGQTFDLLVSADDPSMTRVYGELRYNGAITVGNQF